MSDPVLKVIKFTENKADSADLRDLLPDLAGDVIMRLLIDVEQQSRYGRMRQIPIAANGQGITDEYGEDQEVVVLALVCPVASMSKLYDALPKIISDVIKSREQEEKRNAG